MAAGRLADLGTLISRRPAAEQPRGLMELTGLRVAALAPGQRPRGQPALRRGRLGEHRSRRQRADPARHLPALGGGAGRVLHPRPRTAWTTRVSWLPPGSTRTARRANSSRSSSPNWTRCWPSASTRLDRDRWLTVAAGASPSCCGLARRGAGSPRPAGPAPGAPLATTHADAPDTPPGHDPWQPRRRAEPRELQPAGAAPRPRRPRSGGPSMLLGRLRIRGKLALLVVIPLLSMVGLAVPVVLDRVAAAQRAGDTADRVRLASRVGSLVQDLQQERILSVGFLLGRVDPERADPQVRRRGRPGRRPAGRRGGALTDRRSTAPWTACPALDRPAYRGAGRRRQPRAGDGRVRPGQHGHDRRRCGWCSGWTPTRRRAGRCWPWTGCSAPTRAWAPAPP